MEEKRSLVGIDIFKFVASLLVVLIHTKPFVDDVELQYYSQCCFRIAVPFFFLTSSFFLFQNYYEGKIWKYIKRLLKIYVCWFVVEIYFTYRVHFVDTGYPLEINTIYFIKGLLFNNTFFASWFLMACIQASVITVFLVKWNENILRLLAFICIVLACTWTMYFGLVNNPEQPTKDLFYLSGVIFSYSNSFFVAVPYFYIGYLMAKYANYNMISSPGKSVGGVNYCLP